MTRLKTYEIDLNLRVAVTSDCPMRASDKLIGHVMKGPYRVISWSFPKSIYPELRKEQARKDALEHPPPRLIKDGLKGE